LVLHELVAAVYMAVGEKGGRGRGTSWQHICGISGKNQKNMESIRAK